MCAALRREPHVEREPPSIRKDLAHFENERARRSGESHMLKRSRPQSVKLLQLFKSTVRGAKARATF
eukprot:5142627-Pyramimonas_sp.AAC.1